MKKKDYGAEWRAWRKSQGLTQEDFAIAMDMSRRGVQYVEAGVKTPFASTRMRFRALQKKYEEAKCQS